MLQSIKRSHAEWHDDKQIVQRGPDQPGSQVHVPGLLVHVPRSQPGVQMAVASTMSKHPSILMEINDLDRRAAPASQHRMCTFEEQYMSP
jgi:hypothetical protein